MIVGVISDTHGVLRQTALTALRGVEHIIHAGDIGTPEIVAALEQVAPVTAVRGNMDRDIWARSLQTEKMIVLADKTFYVLHDLQNLDLDPVAAGVQVVVCGHTHHPLINEEKGVIYFNPGSASQRRRGGPKSIGLVRISGRDLQAEIIHLNS